jgi:hemolysin activation/secretion protein
MPRYFHSLTLGLDYKDLSQTTSLAGSSTIDEPISYLPFSVAYDATLQGADSLTQVSASLNFSVRGLADGDIVCVPAQNGNPAYIANEFACKRFGAQADYAYLRVDLKHTRKLAAEWSLYGRLSGQLAGVPLVSSEQFAVGGVDTVRGYLESNSLGDDGLVANLELRAPSYARDLSPHLSEFVPYAFVDGATLRVRDTELLVPRPQSRFDLLSVGLGMRLQGWRGLSGSLDLAHPLHDAGLVSAGDDRLHFSLSYLW